MNTAEYYTVKYRVLRYDHNFDRWEYSAEFNFKDEAEGFVQRGKPIYRHRIFKHTQSRELVLDTEPDE